MYCSHRGLGTHVSAGLLLKPLNGSTRPGPNSPFSFDCVCDALDIDPDVLRPRLRALTLGRAATESKTITKLRLKELSRAQHMTANRVRRRGRSRIVPVRG